MTYTNEELERMKISLGITDEDLSRPVHIDVSGPVDVYIYRIMEYLQVKGYIAETEKNHPETYAIHREDSLESLAGRCVYAFKNNGNYVNKAPTKTTNNAMERYNLYKLTDEEWDWFHEFLEMKKKDITI